jgi:large subunit ribosomal protein L33
MTIEPGSVSPRASRDSASRGAGPRIRVSLACTECESRNYSTTRRPERLGQLSLKKFCPTCNKHTIHKETK